MYQFQHNLKLLKGHINKWNKESFSNIFQEKQALETKIKQHQSQVMMNGHIEELRLQEKALLQDFNHREQQEEVYWNQKSRIKWIQERERNTSFFHKASIQHRKGNRMDRLNKEDGSIDESQEDLETTLNSYFSKLL